MQVAQTLFLTDLTRGVSELAGSARFVSLCFWTRIGLSLRRIQEETDTETVEAEGTDARLIPAAARR